MKKHVHIPKNLPPSQWAERMFFIMCSDITLEIYTNNQFPKVRRKSHAILVLEIMGDGRHKICPCSSKNHDPLANRRYIASGTMLLPSDCVIKYDTHLIELCAFNIPQGSEFEDDFGRNSEFGGLFCWGGGPEDSIKTRGGA
jgi:hypothetical protein